jgi:hypothetical protein
VTDNSIPCSTVLDYAHAQASAAAAAELVVRVLPDGVLLRVRRPSLPLELGKGILYLVGVLSTGSVLLIVLWPGSGARAGGFDPMAYVCTMLAAAFCAAFAVHLFLAARDGFRILCRDPRVGTRFFYAADQEPSWRVDPVKSIEIDREPMQVTLTRPHVLRIMTRRGLQFRHLRGRPVEELEAVATELRSLLRLDAAPGRGFPVVPIGGKM